MKYFLTVLFVSISVRAGTIFGEWKFEELIYNTQRMERSDPALNLRWTFFANGTERLYWDRGNEDFCERFSHFKYTQNTLQTKVFSLNPLNSLNCSSDPDMQLGVTSETVLEIKNNELWLYVSVGEEKLIYVLKKQEGKK